MLAVHTDQNLHSSLMHDFAMEPTSKHLDHKTL